MRIDKEFSPTELKEMFGRANVVSIGYGYMTFEGMLRKSWGRCIVFGVTTKVPIEQLSKKDVIPLVIRGTTTDVVEVGEIRALESRTSRHRPAFPGISLGHFRVTAGTFGLVVKNARGERRILSNNHVMANSNEAILGDPILQPGRVDGGVEADHFAILEKFVPISFGGESPPECPFARLVVVVANFVSKTLGRATRVVIDKPEGTPQAVNTVDAAIARPVEDEDITDDILEIGVPSGLVTADPPLGLEIQKSGRTTGLTTGTILQTGAAVVVSYGPGKSATFVNQIMAGAMSAGGDSGSAVLDMEKNVVGLLFAGSDRTTIINPMTEVFEALDLRM